MAPDITLFPIQQTMPSPLISVIVPIYNMESLLPRCLDSLAAQTLRDLEIICVDDGSTDGSGGIVRKYASGDSRFRLITQENSGRAEARNAGIRAAAAPYLGFADPDDYVEPDMYERLYRLAEESGADMVQCSYSPFLPAESGESRGMAEEKLLHIENTACDGVFTEKGEIFRLFLEDRITGVVWSKLFRRLLPGCFRTMKCRPGGSGIGRNSGGRRTSLPNTFAGCPGNRGLILRPPWPDGGFTCAFFNASGSSRPPEGKCSG